jgi:hypothetical protein
MTSFQTRMSKEQLTDDAHIPPTKCEILHILPEHSHPKRRQPCLQRTQSHNITCSQHPATRQGRIMICANCKAIKCVCSLLERAVCNASCQTASCNAMLTTSTNIGYVMAKRQIESSHTSWDSKDQQALTFPEMDVQRYTSPAGQATSEALQSAHLACSTNTRVFPAPVGITTSQFWPRPPAFSFCRQRSWKGNSA